MLKYYRQKKFFIAEVAELADALDSGSSVRQGCAGSNPAFGTIIDLQ